MEITYSVQAECNQVAGINVEFKGISDINTAFKCANNLKCAFPKVDVICEQTGEIMYSCYIATEFFHPTSERGKTIFKAGCDMCF